MEDSTRNARPVNSGEVRAIQTRYAGCHFRSRLEARWAVFFDALGVPWEYEPQGFEWGAGTANDGFGETTLIGGRYLPDFWLPSIETWFEVKGGEYTDAETRIHFEFAIVTSNRHITAVGDIPTPSPDDPGVEMGGREFMYLDGQCDFYYRWCVCPWCGKPGIEFDGRGARVCSGVHDCVGPCDGEACTIEAVHHCRGRMEDKAYTNDHPIILNAYNAARSARFEHGESGAS